MRIVCEWIDKSIRLSGTAPRISKKKNDRTTTNPDLFRKKETKTSREDICPDTFDGSVPITRKQAHMRTSRRGATKTKQQQQQHLDLVIPFDAARSATFRVDGLVALTTMLKAGALAAGVFYLFGAAILFCALTLTGCALGMKYAASSDRPAQQSMRVAQLEKRLKRGSWRVDDFFYVVLYKLRTFVEALMTLHRSVVDYSFTVSIAESAHLLELHEQLFEHSEQAQNAIDGVRTRAGSVATFQEDTAGKALVTFSPVKQVKMQDDKDVTKEIKPKGMPVVVAAVPPPSQKKSHSKKSKAAPVEAPRGQPEKAAKTPERKPQAIVTSPRKPESNKNVAKSVAALKKQPAAAPLSPVGQSATATKAKLKAVKLTTMLPTLDVQATTVVQRPVEQPKIKTAAPVVRSTPVAKAKAPLVVKSKEVVKTATPSKPVNAPTPTQQSPAVQVIKPTPAVVVKQVEMPMQEEIQTPAKPVKVLFPEPKPIIQYSTPVETAVNKRVPRKSVVAGDSRVVTLIASPEKQPKELEQVELLVEEEDVESAFDEEEYAINFPVFQPIVAAPILTVELVVTPFASKIVHKPFASSSISSPEIRRMLEEVDEMMLETNQLLAGQCSTSPCASKSTGDCPIKAETHEPEEEADPCEAN